MQEKILHMKEENNFFARKLKHIEFTRKAAGKDHVFPDVPFLNSSFSVVLFFVLGIEFNSLDLSKKLKRKLPMYMNSDTCTYISCSMNSCSSCNITISKMPTYNFSRTHTQLLIPKFRSNPRNQPLK